MSVRSRSSWRHVCTQRSMTEFILGIWTPLKGTLDPGVLEHGVQQAGELAVAVPNQEPRAGTGNLKIHDEVLRDLGYPGCNGMRGRAEDADPAGAVLDDRQHV